MNTNVSQMTMVYHPRTRQESVDLHGMANYLLYVMPGACEHITAATQNSVD